MPKNLRLKAKRTKSRSKPRAGKPNQYWGIDMTKIKTQFGWVYVVVVLDWISKKVVGHYMGEQSKTRRWLIALNRAVNKQFPDGVRDHGLSLISDNGCQPTSQEFNRSCSLMDIQQIFTSFNNPKGNADTERFMRTMKEECVWLKQWKTPQHLKTELEAWINFTVQPKVPA